MKVKYIYLGNLYLGDAPNCDAETRYHMIGFLVDAKTDGTVTKQATSLGPSDLSNREVEDMSF
jgi:hypothetical protein